MTKESEQRTFTKLNEFLSEYDHVSLNKKDEIMLKRATKLAYDSPRNKFKLGAIISQNNKIVGRGVNSKKTHPFQSKWNQRSDCLHAEVAAIIDSGIKDFENSKTTIYVARLSRPGQNEEHVTSCSYPCINCWNLLNFIGIRNIVCYNEGGNPVKINVKDNE